MVLRCHIFPLVVRENVVSEFCRYLCIQLMMTSTTPPNVSWVVTIITRAAAKLIIHHQNQRQQRGNKSPQPRSPPHPHALSNNNIATSRHIRHTNTMTVNQPIFCYQPLGKHNARPSNCASADNVDHRNLVGSRAIVFYRHTYTN